MGIRSQSAIDYVLLRAEMKDKIKALPPGQVFVLRNIIKTPSALLGRYLYEDVDNNVIENVAYRGKVGGVNQYIKL